MTNIKLALQEAAACLAGSDSARLDAEVLLAFVLGTPRITLYSRPELKLTTQQINAFHQLIVQRAQGVPVAYLLQSRDFWSFTLCVNSSTLIPRPETELLVECALSLVSQSSAKLLDLGTGSGAVALALAVERPHWEIVAVDCCPEALATAQANAVALGLEQQVTFLHSDWFNTVPVQCFDAIVSNPPYLAEQDTHLSAGDVRFEPRQALVSGVSGLDALRHIIQQSPAFLTPGGWLLLEHGFEQKDSVSESLVQARYQSVQSWQDLQGHDRVSGGQKPIS